MKLTEVISPPVIWLVVGDVLLLFAANCSLQKKSIKEPISKEATNDTFKHLDEDTLRADNSFCYVCHLNYDDEQLTADHELAGIGCAKCHGRSYEHCGDENNITPPEIMYPKAKINPTCMMCHPRQKIKHVSNHDSLLAGAETIFDEKTASKKKCCTDCHAKNHRINVRTIRWNKATGELLDEK